jgi:hypothetical protein
MQTARTTIVASFLTLFFLICATGCGAEDIPPEMRAMCEKDGGLRVFKVVHGVKGLFDAGSVPTPRKFERPPVDARSRWGCEENCKRGIDSGAFEFVEAESALESSRNLAPGPGIFRYTIKEAGHPSCKYFEKNRDIEGWGQRKGVYQHFYDIVRSGRCVGIEKVDSIGTKYAVRFEEIAVKQLGPDHFITRLQLVFYSLEDGEVFAAITRYGNEFRTASGRISTSEKRFRCPTAMPSVQISDIFQPMTKKVTK